jgi:phage FluMu gp28-like protein
VTRAPTKPRKGSQPGFFLPHQLAWLEDRSRIKIWEKARRVGGTWTQSYEDVRDCIKKPGLSVWFSSADMTAASEYLDDCASWSEKLNAAAKEIAKVTNGSLGGIEVIDEEKDILSTVMRFANGSRITVLSSNPKAFRSKGGKIVWDEAAHHDNAAKMWTAAKPSAMWGDDIRIISTHNGPGSTFNQLVGLVREGKIKDASVHRVTLPEAAHGGLVEKILGRPVTRHEIEEWIAQERALCLTESEWLQECMCEPQDESTALLPYALIRAQSRPDLLMPLERCTNSIVVGYDVARKRHFSVVYAGETCGPTLVIRSLKVMEKTPFSAQREVFHNLLRTRGIRRACIDATGIGAQLAEEAHDAFGSLVEPITFTSAVKEKLALDLLKEFQDGTIWIPDDLPPEEKHQQLEGLHAVRKIVTVAGNVRYDAAATDVGGHGDHFWALALAVHAARNASIGPAKVTSRKVPLRVPGIGDLHSALRRFGKRR